MDSKGVFNVTICSIGVVLLMMHVINLLLRKGRRNDENALLAFFSFTAFHFAVYATFVLIKQVYTSNTFIMCFYTAFYIMNNIEVFLLYLYMLAYVKMSEETKKVTSLISLILFNVYVALDLINIFTHIFFTAVDGVYTRAPMMIISQGYQFIMFAIVFLVSVTNKKLYLREKVAFAIYCFFPLVSIIVQNFIPGYAIAYAVLLISVQILFLFVNVERNIQYEADEKELKEARVKMMVSQIQPHFVYNTLSSISTLIEVDPEKAQRALDSFTDYLRVNFSSLTQTGVITFEEELKHIKTYVALEKMRFNDRLNVIYDIQVTNFSLPPLCVQPLVENAIKHGVLKKIEGGTVILKTYENKTAYMVEIIDDGVGFDMNDEELSSNVHIGLSNVRHRINSMVDGDISITSEINKGTRITLSFYK